jgi:hypothetical protein
MPFAFGLHTDIGCFTENCKQAMSISIRSNCGLQFDPSETGYAEPFSGDGGNPKRKLKLEKAVFEQAGDITARIREIIERGRRDCGRCSSRKGKIESLSGSVPSEKSLFNPDLVVRA